MQGALTRSLRASLFGALALLLPAAEALELGEIEVRSALGEPFDARVALAVPRGEYVQGSCFSLAAGAADATAPAPMRLTVHTYGGGRKVLRIRSSAPVVEPVQSLRVRAACPGQAELLRDYTVLLDPRPAAASPPIVAARLNVGSTDTLHSVAERVFPREPVARARYLAALREANPALATYGEGEPLPESTLALPDLRTAASPRRAPPAMTVAAREESRTVRPQAPRSAAPGEGTRRPAPKPVPAARETAPAPAPTQPAAPGARPSASTGESPRPAAFVLKLSSPQLDLTRSQGLGEEARARLRERRLVLDADDQMAALLAMRHNVRQLESRIAELQLKLSTATRAEAAKAAPKSEAPKPGPPKAEAPKPEPPKAEAPKPEPPKAEAPKPEPAKVEAPKPEPPKVEAPKVEVARPAPPKPAAAAALPAKGAAREASGDWIEGVRNEWLLGTLATLLLIIAAGVWYALRTRQQEGAEEAHEPVEPTIERRTRQVAQERPATDLVPAGRVALESDESLSTRLPENSRELRRRYIEERFPEIANRTLVLDDPASVVKAARLFYEDRALPRAVELLQFCIEEHPREVRYWLALFEIFRLERLTGEYADLARRFHEHHGDTEHWRKVQYFGREIDPGNLLYREEAADTLATIGPAQSRRMAAAGFDPIVENWLEAPMDFENEVLANELRRNLMAQARLKEQDLQPNTMPALRSAEIFTVA